MSYPVPVTSSAEHLAISTSADSFATVMAAGQYFVFTSSVACYIAQGDAPVASAADGSTYVGAGESVLIDGTIGPALSVLATDTGVATLTRVKFVK